MISRRLIHRRNSMHSALTRLAAFVLLSTPMGVWAQSPLGDANEINVGGTGAAVDLKGLIVSIMKKVLDFVGLIAVVVIVIAGIWMIVGLGEESSKERAKKIVIYTIIGLLLILIASALVTFVINLG